MNEIRFDLEDIFEAKLTDELLFYINLMSDKVQFEKIVFWYNGNATDKHIDLFKHSWQKIIKKQFPVRFSIRSPQSEYVWFDVISDEKFIGSRNRYSHVYSTDKKSNMLIGLHKYFQVIEFIKNSGNNGRKYYKPKEK